MVLAGGISSPAGAVERAAATSSTTTTAAESAASGSGSAALASAADADSSRTLCVCADPNNLPFSNDREQGFENEIAKLVAKDLGRELRYFWWAQRRGFIRNTLNAHACDVVLGLPAHFDLALTTRPYYRSSYVFVTRRDRNLDLRSLDDARLRSLRIGAHMIGDDYASLPPVQALARRGITGIAGYSIYGDYSKPNPPANLIGAVASGDLDVAVAWGPTAAYFARRSPVRLSVTPIAPDVEEGAPPFSFDIAMGVRKGDVALKAALDGVIARRGKQIRKILERYDVPLAEKPAEAVTHSELKSP
ncbi:MAG TPA: substrate-binding domain-containing protein [Candidatus Eisenbacteria bacterium]|nr:substrate-binding domain-containing protein [Candidatus Eisenbacteria bacterium]